MGSFLSCRCCCEDDEQTNNSTETLLRFIPLEWSSSSPNNNSPEENRGGRRISHHHSTTHISNEKNRIWSSIIQQVPKIVPRSVEEEREYMVRSFSSGALFENSAPECLLCMEDFTMNRPTTLSLCSCGVNKNTFHLDCLLEWRRKSNKTNCPVCDKELYFDASQQQQLAFMDSSEEH